MSSSTTTNPTFPPNSPSSPLSVPTTATALLLCDFHAFLLSTLTPQPHPVLSAATSLLHWARESHIPVYHCLVDVRPAVPQALKGAARYKAIQAQVLAQDRPDEYVAPHPDLGPVSGEMVFKRSLGKISVLSSEGLREEMERNGVRSVVVAGIATSGCIIDSVKALAELGLVVTVVKDACADREVEVHEFVMGRLLPKQAWIVGLEELKEAFEGRE